MNAANEVAVSAFLNAEIPFPGIWETVSSVMSDHHLIDHPGLDEIIDADKHARIKALELIS